MTNEEASNILRLVATEALEGVSRFVESENNRDKFKQAYKMAIKELKRKKKKGKWVNGQCSECGCDVPAYIIDWKWQKDMDAKFCPMCGAKMKK